VAPAGDVPDVSGEIMSFGSGYGNFLYRPFRTQKERYGRPTGYFSKEITFYFS
jgi:hypothetical protein